MKTLVLGLGNPFVTDDAVGLRLACDLQAALGPRSGVDWMPDCFVGGLELLERLAGYDRIIILDAIRTRGGRAGQWYRFTASALRETRHLSNVHDANFATALELGRRLGLAVPADEAIHILAVEILENSCFGETLSPELETAYPQLCREIEAEVRRLLDG